MDFDRLVEKAYREKKPMARSLKGPAQHKDTRPKLKVVDLQPRPKSKHRIWLPKKIRKSPRIRKVFATNK